MDCEAIEPLVYLLEDELDGVESAQLAAHLGGCAECRAARAEFLAARGRLLVRAIPAPLAAIALPRRSPRRELPPWVRAGLASAAALLLILAAWRDDLRRAARGTGPLVEAGESLALRRYRFERGPDAARVAVTAAGEVPRTRPATTPDESWSLLRGAAEPAGEERSRSTPDEATEIGLDGAPRDRGSHVGRMEAGRWEMADLVVQTTWSADGAAPASAAGWRTQLRVPKH